MIHFAQFDLEILRDINLELLDDPRQEYVAVDADLDDPAILRRRIMDVRVSSLERFLHRLGQWPEERFEDAWVRFMAWGVAQQFWPDGNHRTCFLALDVVAEGALGESFSLRVEDMDALRDGSKAILQGRPTLPGRPGDQGRRVHAQDRRRLVAEGDVRQPGTMDPSQVRCREVSHHVGQRRLQGIGVFPGRRWRGGRPPVVEESL